jgi:hypothetical protein
MASVGSITAPKLSLGAPFKFEICKTLKHVILGFRFTATGWAMLTWGPSTTQFEAAFHSVS